MSYISPPPHHDIYSIEDLAQLIADLRAINPARPDRREARREPRRRDDRRRRRQGRRDLRPSRRATPAGRAPRRSSSIKHVGAPWELGLAEVHQTLLRNGLRDRVALRTDGGLRTGRDLLVAALLGAEEFAFGTAMLVAIGCDMARQCHLDTCPTGIATQREDLRAKFAGTPEQVERFALAMAESLRLELAAVGARERRRARRRVAPVPRRRIGGRRRSISRRSSAPVAGPASPARRARPGVGRPRRPPRRGEPARAAARGGARRPGRLPAPTASPSRPPTDRSAPGSPARSSAASWPARSRSACAVPPASRSGRSPGPASSCGSSARRTTTSAKGLSGGRSSSRPEPGLAARAASPGDRRQHLPVRRDRRPAPRRRPGGDALRRPQLRRERRRRGPRPARLRVHDRRGGRRPRAGRRRTSAPG